jgi:hypothetical protein
MKKKNSKPFDPKDPSTWPKSTAKPTEAFTTAGTAAKDLAKSKADNRFSSNAKTKVKSATDAFAGSGTPLGTSMGINPLSQGQIAGALSTAVGGASLGRAIANKVADPVTRFQNFRNAEAKARGDRYYRKDPGSTDKINKQIRKQEKVELENWYDTPVSLKIDQIKSKPISNSEMLKNSRRYRRYENKYNPGR